MDNEFDEELHHIEEALQEDVALQEGKTFPDIKLLSSGAQWMGYTRYPYLLAKVAFWGIIFYAFIWTLTSVSSVAFPVFISLFLAYLIDPAIERLERYKINRTLGIVICLFIALVLTAGFLVYLYPTLAIQVEKLIQNIPKLLNTIQTRLLPWIETTLGFELPPTLAGVVTQYSGSFADAFPSLAQQAGGWLSNILSRTTAVVVSILNLIMIPIFTFYFLRDFKTMRNYCMRFIPPKKRGFFLSRIHLMDNVVGQWFRGQIQVAAILAVLYAVGLAIVFGSSGFGIQTGIAIGLLTGILNVIPYFGFAVGSALAVLVTLTGWVGWWPLFGVIIAYTVIQLLEGYWITPKVVGDKVGLKPITVIIVLLLGAQLAGLLGVLLAIPVAGAIKVLMPDILDWYERSPMFTGTKYMPEGQKPGCDATTAAGSHQAKKSASKDSPESLESSGG